MKAKEGLKLVFGSVVVYVVMAACASNGGSPGGSGSSGSSGVADGSGSSGSGSSGGDGSGSSGGGSSSGGTALDDSGGRGILDALTDPVTEASAAPNQSGSRLKAKYYAGADGSKQFSGWHDSMLNVDCGFVPATDGTTRCIPSYPTAAGLLGYFSDSGCAQPLGLVTKGCSPPAYASQFQAGSGVCATGFTRIFQLGAAYAGPVYTGIPASCTAFTAAGTGGDLYSLGSEVTPSTFVAATVQTDP